MTGFDYPRFDIGNPLTSSLYSLEMSTTSNGTSPQERSTEDTFYQVVTICFFVNGTLAVVFNTIALLVLRQQDSLPEVMHMLHHVHVLLDMVHAICWSIWSITWYSFSSETTCTVTNMVIPFFYYTLLINNMAVLSFLCVSKYILISRPLRYETLLPVRRVKRLLVGTFIIISAVCSMYLPIPGLPFSPKYVAECTGSKDVWTTHWADVFNPLFISIPIIVAFVMMTGTNVGLIRIVLRQSKVVAAGRQEMCSVPWPSRTVGIMQGLDFVESRCDSRRGCSLDCLWCHRKHRWIGLRSKGVVTVLLLQISFYACWIPGLVYFASADQSLRGIFDAMNSTNNWVQPIVYLMTSNEAKKILWKFLNR